MRSQSDVLRAVSLVEKICAPVKIAVFFLPAHSVTAEKVPQMVRATRKEPVFAIGFHLTKNFAPKA
jgi:hypothetical protein